MNQSVLTLSPGGQPLAQSLGFEAASVVVDNLTASYLTLTDVGKTIPPWTYGAVVAIPPGIRQANATLVPTTPAIAGPPVPVAQATLTWTDTPLPADPGHLLQQSQYAQQTLVAEVTGTANQTVGPKTFPVPAGTMSIGFLVRLDSSRGVPQQVTIRGTQSQQIYVTTSTVTTVGVQWFPFGSAVDTSVDVTMTANLGNPSAIDVVASPLVESIDVQETSGTQLPVIVEETGSGVAITTQASPSGRGPSLGVSLFDATPAPWQAAASSSVLDGSTVANGATLSLVAAVAAQKIYVHAVDYKLNAAGNFLLDRSDGTRVAGGQASGVGAQAIDWDGHGVAGAANTSLRINNNSGASITLLGTVGYTQQ